MNPVCPDPKCAEINDCGAVCCHACGKSLIVLYWKGRRINRRGVAA